MAKSKSSAALGGLFVVLAGCLWGTTGLFIKELNMAGLTSMQICELRAAITALVMLLLTVCIKPSLLRIRLRDIWIFLGSGVGSILFFNYCYFNAIQASGMAVAATLLYTSPVFVMLLSLPLFGEKITGRKVVSLIMTVAGCVLVSGVFAAGSSFTKEGVLYGIGAGFGYALHPLCYPPRVREYDHHHLHLFGGDGGRCVAHRFRRDRHRHGGGWRQLVAVAGGLCGGDHHRSLSAVY